MRDVFPGYYKPTKNEMDELWSSALVVLDTNALFNLFRYTNATRTAFLNVLSEKKDRLWLPHQVGLEFQRGRLGIIEDQAQAFTDLISKSKTALASVTKDVGTLRNHPTLDLDELRSTVREAITAIEQKIEATRERYESEVVAAARHDKTTDTITELYAERVGSPYTDEEIAEFCKTGAARYEAKQPPGYKDGHKPEPDRYGDLILWFQLLDKAAADDTAVIFVGDDQKEDWWREFKGRKIGPRIELVDEFRDRTGKRIYFLTPHGLMELAKKYDDASISKDTVQEVAQVSEAQARLNDYIHRGDHKRRLREDPDYAAMATVELENSIRRMQDYRDRREKSLRSRLSIMEDLESRGLGETDDYFDAQRALSRYRSNVANVSSDLKAAEFELMSRRNSEFSNSLRRDYGQRERLGVARTMLSRHGAPVITGAEDWHDVSDADMLDLITYAERGLAPDAVVRALHPIFSERNTQTHGSHWGKQESGGLHDVPRRLED